MMDPSTALSECVCPITFLRMLLHLDGRTQKLLRQAMEGGDGTSLSTPREKKMRSSARKQRSSSKYTPRCVLIYFVGVISASWFVGFFVIAWLPLGQK